MNAPNPVPVDPSKAASRGSLALGVALAWAMMVGGYLVVILIAATIGPMTNGAYLPVLSLLPWVGLIGLIVWFATHDRPRTAIGVVIGIASIIGVGLLLIAACFGLLATNFH